MKIAVFLNWTILTVGKDVEQQELSFTASGKMVEYFARLFSNFLQNQTYSNHMIQQLCT